MQAAHKITVKKILFLICSIAVIFAITLYIYSQSAIAQEPYNPSPDSTAEPKGLVEVKMNVIGVDPVENQLEARLRFELKGI
jgi:hypothetical protein